jgi:tetratricopeptide (TPR) repeat protein
LEPDHLDVAINVNALAILYEKRGDLNNALCRFAEALQIRRSKLGPCHIDVASIYNNMAVVYETLGQLPEAIDKYEQAVGVFRTKLGRNHNAVATILNNLGNVYKSQGMFQKSAESYQGALAIRCLLVTERKIARAREESGRERQESVFVCVYFPACGTIMLLAMPLHSC